MSDPLDLVSIYQAANSTEAFMVKNLLAEEGIEASVSEVNEPLAGLPIAAPDVLVREADEARARQFIADYEETLIAAEEGGEVGGAEDDDDALDDAYEDESDAKEFGV